jgi:hypothetical protein
MAYVTAITDRDLADIAALNSKAYWNVADWTRVYGNSLEANTALTAALGVSISFDTQATPTTASIPTIAEINEFTANIERMRLWLATYAPIADSDFIEIKDDWAAGQSETAPNYIQVNSWEKVLDLIYQIYKSPYSVTRSPRIGVAGCGRGLTRNNMFRG